jgi:hypothetical protein
LIRASNRARQLEKASSKVSLGMAFICRTIASSSSSDVLLLVTSIVLEDDQIERSYMALDLVRLEDEQPKRDGEFGYVSVLPVPRLPPQICNLIDWSRVVILLTSRDIRSFIVVGEPSRALVTM